MAPTHAQAAEILPAMCAEVLQFHVEPVGVELPMFKNHPIGLDAAAQGIGRRGAQGQIGVLEAGRAF